MKKYTSSLIEQEAAVKADYVLDVKNKNAKVYTRNTETK